VSCTNQKYKHQITVGYDQDKWCWWENVMKGQSSILFVINWPQWRIAAICFSKSSLSKWFCNFCTSNLSLCFLRPVTHKLRKVCQSKQWYELSLYCRTKTLDCLFKIIDDFHCS
jgi:hypothetical protein